jgi:hypothetical protein
LLKKKYVVEISAEPDLLFFSYFGTEHLKYKCHKVQYLGENVSPDFRIADYAISFDHLENPSHLRLPLYAIVIEERNYLESLLRKKNMEQGGIDLDEKKGFCSFVVSNKLTQSRIDFFHKLSEYKKVDSGGKVLNNIGGPVDDKISFVNKCKFNICFENAIFPGYVTEKIIEAKFANTVPIYWGDPKISEELNPRAFINYHDFNSMKKMLEHVKEVDNNKSLLLQYLQTSIFYDNHPNQYLDSNRVLNFLSDIVDGLPFSKPISQPNAYQLNSFLPYYALIKKRKRNNVVPYKPDW